MEKDTVESIGHLKKGDLIYALFIYDNQEEAKERLALILFKSEVNSFVICAITSKLQREHAIKINVQDVDSGKIGYDPSFIRPNVIATINKALIRRKIGTLKQGKLEEVTNRVKELIDKEPEEPTAHQAIERPHKRKPR